MKSTPSGETRQFKLFGSGPIEAESTLIERAVKRLDDIVALASSGPTVIAVEALTSQEARRVIEAWLSRQKSPAPTVLRLQPWRSNAQDVDLRILISSQLIQECRASDGSNKVGALLGLGTARESADLYRWLQSGSWSPVMQAELDGVVREWLRQLPDHQRFFVVIEGIEKCQPPPVQETCYKVLASLLRDPRAITLIDSKVSKDLSEAWKVDASIEVPTLSPPRFQRWILQLLGLSAVTNDGSHESSVRWARIISDASYPYLFKAKRIVNDIALSADQAVDALAEEINDHHSTNRAPLEGQRSSQHGVHERSPVKVSRADLGELESPESPLSKICFMVVLAHRFPDLARHIQTRVDGTDALIRLVLWSRRAAVMPAGAQSQDKRPATDSFEQLYSRISSDPWQTFAQDPVLGRFLRDLFWRDEPLVRLFADPTGAGPGGRSAMTSYIWANRRGLVTRGTELSRPAQTSLFWWIGRQPSSVGERQRPDEPANAIGAARVGSQMSWILASDDWELMSSCALDMVEGRPTTEAGSTNARGEDAETLARTAVQRARRAQDEAGEIRARGALAVVLASLGSTDLADEELKLAASIGGQDSLDRSRLAEFRARVAMHKRTKPEEQESLWLDAFNAASIAGLDDVAIRAANMLGRIGTRPTTTIGRGESSKPLVFLSYRSEDAYVADRVKTMLKSLDAQGVASAFFDDLIEPSVAWWGRIRSHLSQSNIAVVLLTTAYVTRRFTGDDYCYLEADHISARWEDRGTDGFHALLVNVEGVQLPNDLGWGSRLGQAHFVWGKGRPRGQRPTEEEIVDLCRTLEAEIRKSFTHPSHPA